VRAIENIEAPTRNKVAVMRAMVTDNRLGSLILGKGWGDVPLDLRVVYWAGLTSSCFISSLTTRGVVDVLATGKEFGVSLIVRDLSGGGDDIRYLH